VFLLVIKTANESESSWSENAATLFSRWLVVTTWHGLNGRLNVPSSNRNRWSGTWSCSCKDF